MIKTNVKMRILLYLFENGSMDQGEITYGVSANRGTISRTLGLLLKEKKIERMLGVGNNDKRKVQKYSLTEKGQYDAERIRKKLEKNQITIVNQKQENCVELLGRAQEYISDQTGKTVDLVTILTHLDENNRVRLEKLVEAKRKTIDFATIRLKIDNFYGREEEFKKIREFITSSKRILSIYGLAGIGKTSLISKMLEEYEDQHNIFCYRFHEFSSLVNIFRCFANFLSLNNQNKLMKYLNMQVIDEGEMLILLQNEFKNFNALLFFDDVHKLLGNNKAFFRELLRHFSVIPSIKIIISGRWVSYLYEKKEILQGHITELNLKGLTKEATFSFLISKGLQKNVDAIYEKTKGHPLLLSLINTDKSVESDIISFLRTEICQTLTNVEKEILKFYSVFRYPSTMDFFVANDLDMSVVDQLVKKSLFQYSHGVYDEHDSIRNFFYTELTVQEKKKYHTNAGKYYEDKEGNQALIETLYHYAKARNQKQAIDIFRDHGESIMACCYQELKGIISILEHGKINPKERITILLIKGRVFTIEGKYDKGIKCYSAGLRIAKREEDKSQIVNLLLRLGEVYFEKNAWFDALKNFKSSLKIAKKENDREAIMYSYYHLANIHWRLGKLEKATDYIKRCIRGTKDQTLKAKGWIILGLINGDQSKHDETIKLYRKAQMFFERRENIFQVIRVYNNLAVAYTEIQKIDHAIVCYNKQLALSKDIGYLKGIAFGLTGLAGRYIDKKMLDKALMYCEEGLAIAEMLNNKLIISIAHNVKGNIFIEKRQWKEAKKHLDIAIKLANEVKIPRRLAAVYYDYAQMYHRKNNWKKARIYYLKVLRYYQRCNDEGKCKEIKGILESRTSIFKEEKTNQFLLGD